MKEPKKNHGCGGWCWSRQDWLCGAGCALVSLAVYLWTLAPGVTLLDSGEFLLAAAEFGVPHPTGYPLWTVLAWLFQLVVPGNPAVTVAMFSAVCGAAGVGLAAFLGSGMLRWIFPALPDVVRSGIAVAGVLLFAFSESMWSQAVIAEVYTLHVLLVVLFVLALFCWIQNPESDAWLAGSFFLLALSFSNHHLILTLVPLPFLAVLLLRRALLPELLFASVLTGAVFLLLFASLSGEEVVWNTAVRFAWLIAAGGIVFFWRRGVRRGWHFIYLLPVVVAAGLLPYAYMPIASSTNPPMNWSYTRDADGFYFAVNRSQYGGSLDTQILRTIGRITGTSGARMLKLVEEEEEWKPWEKSRFEKIQSWSGFFWLKLVQSFTPLGLLGFFCALFLLRSASLPQRTWLYLLMFGFFLAAFLQPFADGASADNAGWWLQMPFHGYTNLFFGLLMLLGFAVIHGFLASRNRRAALGFFVVLGISPAWPLVLNYSVCSQRDRWFGWEFGVQSLKHLPRDSVVLGGSDPGRFVPTWMILGESFVRPEWKRDPEFDRRDLYILTQNALADPYYLRYLRDHYGEGRPVAETAFEKWLGREGRYPTKPLRLPDDEELLQIAKTWKDNPEEDLGLHGEVARWVFEHNKKEHAFFLEESIPMQWTYAHAIPEGFLFRLNPEPLDAIPPEKVREDFDFWQKFLERSLNNPLFVTDYDAKRTFSSLRTTAGNVYSYRGLEREAEAAYLQALLILPSNIAALMPVSAILWEREDFDAAKELWDAALADDPHNDAIAYFRSVAYQREALHIKFKELRQELLADPKSPELWKQLLEGHLYLGEEELLVEILREALGSGVSKKEVLEYALQRALGAQLPVFGALAVRELLLLEPEDWRLWLQLAVFLQQTGDTGEALSSLKKAEELGGVGAAEAILGIPKLLELKAVEAPSAPPEQ